MIDGSVTMTCVRIAIALPAHILPFSINAAAATLAVTALATLCGKPVAAQTPATTNVDAVPGGIPRR